ncbi:MAG: ASPIC/UnbV domain-containing protein [Planctomycetota bacterium]
MDQKDRAKSATDFALEQLARIKRGHSFSGYERDLVALNLGDGTFLDISGVSGADSVTDGRGALYADLDDDGDLDIFLRAMHGPAHRVFNNEIGQDAGWLRVVLEGRASGRDAFGAVVRVRVGDRTLARQKSGGSGYLAQHDPRILVGLGRAKQAEWIEVTWPSGAKQRLAGPFSSGGTIRIIESK